MTAMVALAGDGRDARAGYATPMNSSTARDVVRPLLQTRQVREYTSEPVDDDAIDAIADVARWSGSSTNSQPWRFVVIRDPETLRAIHDVGLPSTRSLATAPRRSPSSCRRNPGEG